MRNRVLNITGTGGFVDVTLPASPVGRIVLQVRTSAAMQYRYTGQTDFFTVKADDTLELRGRFEKGDLQVQAAGGVVIEIEYSTVADQMTG